MIQRTHLKERLDQYIAANNYQLAQIETIYKLVAMKRDAEAQYLNSINEVRKETERIATMPGLFILDLLGDFKTYLAVIYQNQAVKVQTYDQQILASLQGAIHKTVDSVLTNRVVSTQQRIAQSLAVVRQKRAQLKSIGQEIQLIRSEVRFKEKMRTLTAAQRTVMAQRFQDLVKLRDDDIEVMGQHISNLVNCSELYSQTYREIQEEEKLILEPKASAVYDNFVRAIVVDTTAVRNLNYEMDLVFKRFKAGNHTFNKEKSIKLIRSALVREKTLVKSGFMDKYRALASQEPFTLEERYIPQHIKQEWRVVEGNLRGFMSLR